MNDPTILQLAADLVDGDRQEAYGHPADSLARVALTWSAILDVEVTAEQVGLCMIGLKICRQANRHKLDNLVDIAGYAQVLAMIREREV